MEYIKVNLPNCQGMYEQGAGEGVWCLVDEETKRAHDADEEGAGYFATLDNDSFYWVGLEHGERMPIELRGENRPVVPYAWLAERFEVNPAWAVVPEEPRECPFCGNENLEVFEDEGGAWSVYCDFCNANLYGYETRGDVVRQWNHRYKPEQH